MCMHCYDHMTAMELRPSYEDHLSHTNLTLGLFHVKIQAGNFNKNKSCPHLKRSGSYINENSQYFLVILFFLLIISLYKKTFWHWGVWVA